jgi:hypothetical protein
MARSIPLTLLWSGLVVLGLAGEWSVVQAFAVGLEVAAGRMLDGDPQGALEALAAVA